MPERFQINKIWLDREVNFKVFDHTGYLFRLVPNECGFELSKLDLSLGTEVPSDVLVNINETILNGDE